MKIKFLYKKSLLCAAFILLLAVIGCEKTAQEPPEPEPTSPLRGTSWQLIGFGDTQTGTFREIERECESHFTLKFDGYTLFAHSIENEFISFYGVNYETGRLGRGFFFHHTQIPEPDDGKLFLNAFWYGQYFSITTRGELQLLNRNDNIYLLFEPQQPEPVVSLSRTSWRVAGIVNIETGVLRELEDQDYFWLAFGNKIFTTTAFLSGYYNVDYEINSISGFKFFRAGSYDMGDGGLFTTAVQYMRSFSLTDNELRLYSLVHKSVRHSYTINNSYLLFKLH